MAVLVKLVQKSWDNIATKRKNGHVLFYMSRRVKGVSGLFKLVACHTTVKVRLVEIFLKVATNVFFMLPLRIYVKRKFAKLLIYPTLLRDCYV